MGQNHARARCGLGIWNYHVPWMAQYMEHGKERQSASHSPDSLQMRCPRRSWSLGLSVWVLTPTLAKFSWPPSEGSRDYHWSLLSEVPI